MTETAAAPRVLDAERRQRLIAFVEEHQGATVGRLGEHLGVSEATVRRDLTRLSRGGLIERAHGGAVPHRVRPVGSYPEPPILERASVLAEEKRRIGRLAADQVEDGDTIMIAGGTTTAHMIPWCGERTGLTVVTNNLNVAGLLAPFSRITAIVIGGVLRHSGLSLHGALAEGALENLRVDKLFIGSSAVHVDYGLSADDLAEVETDRALMRAARQIIVLADRTKFGRVRTIRVIPIQRVSRIVTDVGIGGDQVEALRALGVVVDVA